MLYLTENRYKMLLFRCGISLYLIYDKRERKLLTTEVLPLQILMFHFQPVFSVFPLFCCKFRL